MKITLFHISTIESDENYAKLKESSKHALQIVKYNVENQNKKILKNAITIYGIGGLITAIIIKLIN